MKIKNFKQINLEILMINQEDRKRVDSIWSELGFVKERKRELVNLSQELFKQREQIQKELNETVEELERYN